MSYAARDFCYDDHGEVFKGEEKDRQAFGTKVCGFSLAGVAGEVIGIVVKGGRGNGDGPVKACFVSVAGPRTFVLS